MTAPIIDLDATDSTEPSTAGAKAAWMARARRAGLPVLPGFVIPAAHSVPTMDLGVAVLHERGPGGARLAMAQHPLPIAVSEAVNQATESLGVPVIVRSSSLLEDNGEWAGAFESFAAERLEDVEPAVRSCWASAFTLSTLMRAEAAGIRPGSVPMAILVQPFVEPDFGGTARIAGDDVEILVTEGSPAPLLDGKVEDSGASTSLDVTTRHRIEEVLRAADEELGVTSCDWALVDREIVLFQLTRAIRRVPVQTEVSPHVRHPMAERVAGVIRRAPGPIGRQFVLPWAIGMAPALLDDLAEVGAPEIGPLKAVDLADEVARTLTAQAWDRARPIAWDEASKAIAKLTQSDPRSALDSIAELRTPDLESAGQVLSLVKRICQALTALRPGSHLSEAWHIEIPAAVDILSGARAEAPTGIDALNSFDAAVIATHGQEVTGVAASPGRRSGRACLITDPADLAGFQPRDIVVAPGPHRDLAPLLWTAGGLVTKTGAPAAHLFEVARARGIPAVTGVDLDALDLGRQMGRALCVDGFTGSTFSVDW